MSETPRTIRLLSPGELAERVRVRGGETGTIALLLDYDGTLVPIAARPEEARADAAIVRILGEIAAEPRLLPAVVTGRTLADLGSVLPVPPGVFVFGTHGARMRGPDGTETDLLQDEESERIIHDLRGELEKRDLPPGVWVEDKGVALGLHYRQASAGDADRARREFARRLAAADPKGRLRVIEGKRIREVRPRGLDKGLAVARMKSLAPAVTVYVGDDATDEDAFRALGERDVGILVASGERETAAGYRLTGPETVRRFLRELVFKIRGEGR